MQVKVKKGYAVVNVAGVDRKSGEIFDVSEADYKGLHWIFEVVTSAPVEVKTENVVTVEAVAAEDVLNTAIASPIIRRGRRK